MSRLKKKQKVLFCGATYTPLMTRKALMEGGKKEERGKGEKESRGRRKRKGRKRWKERGRKEGMGER